jgi:hypothetical protein
VHALVLMGCAIKMIHPPARHKAANDPRSVMSGVVFLHRGARPDRWTCVRGQRTLFSLLVEMNYRYVRRKGEWQIGKKRPRLVSHALHPSERVRPPLLCCCERRVRLQLFTLMDMCFSARGTVTKRKFALFRRSCLTHTITFGR